eukprot:NODE_578_length_6506_cov_0.092711.p5 type:complete len:140 gc:universal NODE_578_length_6506_cov_0.092711:1816-2235(+)
MILVTFIFLRSSTFCLFMKNEYNMLTPLLSIVISNLYLLFKILNNSCNVTSPWMINLSHRLNSTLLYLYVGGAIGSANPKKGSAKLINPFLNCSSLHCSTILIISSTTNPLVVAVVVAIAGIILPLIFFVVYLSTASIS